MSSFARLFFRLLFSPVIWFHYRIRKTGLDRVPRYGGVLLLSNHVSYIDAFIIYVSSPRPVRFVVLEQFTRAKGIAWFVNLFGGIPIRPEKAKEAITRTVEALKAGGVVCLFPEGGLTRLGVTAEFKKGFELIARRAECPVVPVYMDGLWPSIFSFERGRYFNKWPRRLPCPLQVAFGHPIPAAEATVEKVRSAIWEMSGEAYAMRRDFDEPLECGLIRSLKCHRRRTLFAEYGKSGGREWSRAYTLGLATAMARRWMNHPSEPGDRIGILLPPGPMSSVINLGLFLAGKTPVNLPFTINQHETEALANVIAPLGIRTVITSRAFMPHLIDFWQGDEGVFIDLKAVISPPGSLMAMFERIRAFIEPTWLTCWRLDLTKRDPGREAVGIVTRPGETAVFLSATALFRNARRVISANFVQPDDVLFTEDYLSSPEGLLLGCWVPALGWGSAVCRSFSMREDFDTLEKALLEQGVTLIAGSGKFFKAINNTVGVRSVKYGILFGPANQWDIADWEKMLDIPLARAWAFGGQIVSMSRPDPDYGDVVVHLTQRGRDPKSVGRLLPGFAAKLEDERLWLNLYNIPDRSGKWIAGPKGTEIAPDGLIFLRDVDLA
jgi:acyl-[acyl-carrier-protein]-phospholipid O-acyltransferase / long-chain-fatty-acid--[acyl-carrier-protein] ligase